MNLPRRLFLAIPLTPIFWLLYMWIYVLSGQKDYPVTIALVYSLLMSFVSAYCVVLFCCKWRQDSTHTIDR